MKKKLKLPATIYIATYTTRQRDERVGKPFTSRDAVETECKRLEAQENVDEAYFVIRELEQ